MARESVLGLGSWVLVKETDREGVRRGAPRRLSSLPLQEPPGGPHAEP